MYGGDYNQQWSSIMSIQQVLKVMTQLLLHKCYIYDIYTLLVYTGSFVRRI